MDLFEVQQIYHISRKELIKKLSFLLQKKINQDIRFKIY